MAFIFQGTDKKDWRCRLRNSSFDSGDRNVESMPFSAIFNTSVGAARPIDLNLRGMILEIVSAFQLFEGVVRKLMGLVSSGSKCKDVGCLQNPFKITCRPFLVIMHQDC
jgi:hypothetical protein